MSLDAQRAKLNAYAMAMDLHLVEVIVDEGRSAKTLERRGLQTALSLLNRGQADALLVTKLDRLTRSVKDLGFLVERYFASGRYSLLSVSDSIDTRSPSGRLVLNVLGSVAQWERELRSVLRKWPGQGRGPRQRKEVNEPILDNLRVVQVKFLPP